MITKKLWDELSLNTKKSIINTIYNSAEARTQYKTNRLLYPYKHNFDYNSTGQLLKYVLSCCYTTNSENLIRISVNVGLSKTGAKFLETPAAVKKTNKAPINTVSKVEICRWYCDYISKTDDDVAHLWCEADSKEEARSYFLSKHWDIKEIINIYKR